MYDCQIPKSFLADRDLAADSPRVFPHELRERVARGVECFQTASVRVGVSASREGRAEELVYLSCPAPGFRRRESSQAPGLCQEIGSE